MLPSIQASARALSLTLLWLMLAACEGPQSALNPASPDALRLAQLFWWMLAAGTAIWAVVVGLALYASRVEPERMAPPWPQRLIFWGGIVFPTVTLAVLLTYGLLLLRPQALAGAEPLEIEIVGEQWWWRVHYPSQEGGGSIASANELRLPRDRLVELSLVSADVIHSFWVPPLGGKLDMIPGRRNRLLLRPSELGEYRGACAEFCGSAHALMALPTVVMEPQDFESWLTRQAAAAEPPQEEEPQRGAELFLALGCGGCHSIRGTEARGRIGPDLTHVGSRLSLGAGILPNGRAAFEDWIARTDEIKPGVHMPAFGMLSPDELAALSAYLEGLR